MPRAGSTLLEQILAAHSQVDGTRELPNILSLAQRLRRRSNGDGERPGYPAILPTWTPRPGAVRPRLHRTDADSPRRDAAALSSTRCRTTSGTSG
jgi:hypothetical protein